MNILDTLIGKKITVKTDVGAEATLEIKEVKKNNHSEELGPSTPENDWWPPTREWSTYTVFFTNGFSKTYSALESITIL